MSSIRAYIREQSKSKQEVKVRFFSTLVEQPLIDVRNNAVIEQKKIENSKFIPFVKGMVG